MPQVTTVPYRGAAIRERRRYCGFTLEELAQAIGYSQYTLGDLERQRRPYANLTLLGKVARELKCKPEEFYAKAAREAA